MRDATQKAYASLRLFSDDLDPSTVTTQLEIAPDHTHRRGERRVTRTIKGKCVAYGPYSSNLWSMSSKAWIQSHRLETHLAWLLNEIETKTDIFRRLQADGWKADAFCYSLGPNKPAIPRKLTERFGALGIEIIIDHYASDEPGEAQP